MLAAGLLILKIIGILVLGILGLILAVILLVLLVPIRYRAEGSYHETLKATTSVSWLLHILSCKVIYEKELDVVIRIFGFRVGQREKKIASDEMTPEEIIDSSQVDTAVKEETSQSLSQQSKPESKVKAESKAKVKPKKAKTKRKNIFSFERICDKLREINQRKEEILNMIKDEGNQKTFRLLWKQLKALLKHILPRKVRGHVRFGFDDPYTTGQVLMYASPFYGLYQNKFQLIPVFEESILEGDCWLKGKIRIGTMLVIGIRILLDKNFRKLLKKWRD